MMAFDWEFFVRIAFGFVNHNGRLVHRGGDPAGLATNDILSERRINDVKAITAYAMEILNTDIKNRETQPRDEVLVTIDSYILQVIKALTIGEIENITESYKNSIFNEYFKYDSNVLTRKKGKT